MKKNRLKKIIIVICILVLICASFYIGNRIQGYPKQYRSNQMSYVNYQQDAVEPIENKYAVSFDFAKEFDENGVKMSQSSKNQYLIETADIERQLCFANLQKIGDYISFQIYDADHEVHFDTKIYLSNKPINTSIEEPPLLTNEGSSVSVNGHSFKLTSRNTDEEGCSYIFSSSDFHGYYVLGQIQYENPNEQNSGIDILMNGYLNKIFL